jgi:nucleoside-diphosphate-sugar epimerase
MTAQERTDNQGKLVCITGASGFIGTHVVRECLARGYRVRATVRDHNNPEKVAHLKELAKDAAHPLELFSADLLKPGSFDEAFAGCDFICHVAASVKLTASDPQKEIVDPAVLGTKQILESASRVSSLTRIVMTSSIAAIYNNQPRPTHVYTEKDWCEDATLQGSPYPLAKTLSERAAWEYIETHKPSFDLVTIQPAYVLGPLYTTTHMRSSPTLMRDLLLGNFPMAPRFSFGVVDVRDVADAHVNALELPNASGRYMINHQSMWVREMALLLKQAFPDNKRIPTRNMPNFLMYIAALFDKRLSFSFLRRNLGTRSQFDNSKSINELGITYRNINDTIIDTGKSMLERNLITPK